MKPITICYFIIVLVFFGLTFPGQAVTVYFKDGTQLEVNKITRVGDTACLFVDISRLDTLRTRIDEPEIFEKVPQKGSLMMTDVDFAPSEDNSEIIATGNVINQTDQAVQHIQVTITLMDREDNILVKIHGYTQPDVLSPEESGQYVFRIKKPEGFWRASVDVKADVVP